MVEFMIDQVRGLMDKVANIRNISVIGHGAADVSESLVQGAVLPSIGKLDHTRDNEVESHTTIKSTAISLLSEASDEDIADIKQKTQGKEFLINLTDSPGNSKLIPEVTDALRVTDGALVAVDYIDGLGVQNESLLRRALFERIKPVVLIDKVDRALLELQVTKEDLYLSLARTVESVNVVIATYKDECTGDWQVYPEKGTVAFGSSYHGWAFTVRQFAVKYAKKFGVDRDKMSERLWGDSYFNPKTKEWSNKDTDADGEPLDRAFNMFVLDPIFRIHAAIMNFKKDEIPVLLQKLEITLLAYEEELEGERLLRTVMHKFLPFTDALLEMIVLHLPSPVTAQAYRAELLYEGPRDDEYYNAIHNCDPKGPLMFYIAKMVPTSETGRFYAFGRVFAGTIRGGQKVRIEGPNYVPGKKDDLFIKSIQRTVLMMGRYVEQIDDFPAGNICGLVGIDQFLLKSGTLTTGENAHNLKVMKFSVSPFVQVAVQVTRTSDLIKLVEGLQRLRKSDPYVSVYTSNSGEHIVAGNDELHLRICLNNLEDYARVPLSLSPPFVVHRETVCDYVELPHSHSHFSVSSTRSWNDIRLSVTCLPEELCIAIESGKISARDDFNARARVLADDYGLDVTDGRRILCFGPDETGANLLVDQTKNKGVQYLQEIKDSVVAGFQSAMKEGPIMGEQMRGVRINILDVTLDDDTTHRGAHQIIPIMRQEIRAGVLSAYPGIQEPFFLVEIQGPENAIGGIFSVLNVKDGRVFSEEQRPGTDLFTIKAYLPINESFGFTDDIRISTDGQAIVQMCLFDHWETMNGNPVCMSFKSKLRAVITESRKRNGMKELDPGYEQHYDKL